MGRRAMVPPELAKRWAELSPGDRGREIERYLEEHGESVEETSDGWTPYAPLAAPPEEPAAGDETR